MMQPDDIWADRYFEHAEHSEMINADTDCRGCGEQIPDGHWCIDCFWGKPS